MIDWLIQSAADAPQLAGGLPPAGFLSVAEKAVYDRLRHEKRRKDWLLGRWTAKKLLRDREEKSGNNTPSYHQISILAAQDGAPEIWLEGAARPDRGEFHTFHQPFTRRVILCHRSAIISIGCRY